MCEVVSGWTGKWMDRWMSFEAIAFISAIVYSLKNSVFNFQLLNFYLRCGLSTTVQTNLLVNSPCPVSPPERRGPDSPSASPPSQSCAWEWAGTDRRTHRRCWSSASTLSSAESYAAVPRTGLHQENEHSCKTLKSHSWNHQAKVPSSPTILLSSLSKCFFHMTAASSEILWDKTTI